MKLDRVVAVRNTKTIYQDGDRCIKVFHDAAAKADVFSEALNHARVEETALHIPKLHGVMMIDGKWAISSDFIRGKTLARSMQEEGGNRGVSLARFVELQLQVQAQDCPGLYTMQERLARRIGAAGLDEAVCGKLIQRLNDLPGGSSLCHGDFNPSNIIVAEDGSAYILDWSHAVRGNGAADAAKSELLFRLNGEQAMAEEYRKLFCKNSGIPEGDVEKWLPVVAAAQLVLANARERKALLGIVNRMNHE